MRTLGYVLLSGVLGVVGQLLLKQGMVAAGPLAVRAGALPGLAAAVILNPLVVLGLAVYVSGTFFWLLILSHVDLSYAYPLASLNNVLVLFASWLLLGERPSAARLIGVVSICLGVWAISRTTARTARADRSVGTPAPAIVGVAD